MDATIFRSPGLLHRQTSRDPLATSLQAAAHDLPHLVKEIYAGNAGHPELSPVVNALRSTVATLWVHWAAATPASEIPPKRLAPPFEHSDPADALDSQAAVLGSAFVTLSFYVLNATVSRDHFEYVLGVHERFQAFLRLKIAHQGVLYVPRAAHA